MLGDYAYLADDWKGLQVINVSNPANPIRVGGYNTTSRSDSGQTEGVAHGVSVVGNYAYVAAEVRWDGRGFHWVGDFQIIDVSNPLNCVRVGRYDTSGIGDAECVTMAGNYAYVMNLGGSGLELIDVRDPANPSRVGGIESITGTGFVVRGNYVYVASGTAGLIVIDVSNPSKPVRVSSYSGNVVGIAVKENYAIVVGDSMQVIDISNPINLRRIGGYSGYASRVAIAGNYAYVSGNGLRVIDISDPTNCVLAGDYNISEMAQDIAIVGNYVYVAFGTLGLQIFKIISPPRGAIATAQILNGFVVGVTITDSGYGYTNAPAVVIEGAGAGATATASVKDGIVDKILVDNAGKNYNPNNTLVLIDWPPFMPEV